MQEELQRKLSLKGKVGIVTGGSQGIGLGIVKILCQAGAKVHSFSRSGAKENSFVHPLVCYHAVDVTDKEALSSLVGSIFQEKACDFLINNAGMTYKEEAQVFPEKEFDKIIELNTKSLFQLSQIAYPFLVKSKTVGRIVNISSMASHLGFSGVVPYSISKSSVLGLTKGLAVEWAGDNILVNSVAPGWIYTEMTKGVRDEDRLKRIKERMPLHRFGKIEDIGYAVFYLVSEMGQYITGQDFAIDGGALSYGY